MTDGLKSGELEEGKELKLEEDQKVIKDVLEKFEKKRDFA